MSCNRFLTCLNELILAAEKTDIRAVKMKCAFDQYLKIVRYRTISYETEEETETETEEETKKEYKMAAAARLAAPLYKGC